MLGRLTGATQAVVKKHLEWICRITTSRPGLVFSAVSLTLLLSGFSIYSTKFEADVFKLFPTQQGAIKLFLDSLQWTGSANEAYFLLEGEREQIISEAEVFAGRLKALKVAGEPAFRKITYRVYDQAEARAFSEFIGYAVSNPQFFLPKENVDAYLNRLTPSAIDRSLDRAGAELAGGLGGGMRDLITADPLALRDLITPRLKRGSQALDLDPDSPYFLSKDGKALIIIAQPYHPVRDMEFARGLAVAINKARKGAKVGISCAGAHLSAVIDEATMKKDILACILSSLAVVLLLFFCTYRRILPTLLLPVIIVCGVIPALGLAGVFLPSIHIISFAFTALIIGLGTDYSIHLYDRYHMERCGGKDSAEALQLAVVDTGYGIFTAATTTALPFLALVVSDVRALFELGLLVGLGVIFSMYATFFFLPPLIILMERFSPSFVYKPLPTFGLKAIRRGSIRLSRPVRIVSFIAVALFAGMAFFTTFEGDLKNLQPRHSEAFQAQEKMERHLSLSPKQMMIAIEGGDLQGLLERGAKVDLLAERYLKQGGIVAYSSLNQLVNDGNARAETASKLSGALKGKDAGITLVQGLEKHGFNKELFKEAVTGLSSLGDSLSSSQTEAVDRLAASPLKGAVDRHLARDGSGYHLLVYLFYKGAEFQHDSFLKELASVDPLARVTSVDMVSSQLSADVKKSFTWAFLIGGLLVLFLLFSHFSSTTGIFASLYPVLAGVVAMLGIMAGIGMKINFMNAMVLVTILGMGSDYGLHIAHRFSEDTDDDSNADSFVQAGRAVLLSALTSIAGFGSLAFADYGALSSIGWATNFGVLQQQCLRYLPYRHFSKGVISAMFISSPPSHISFD